MSKIISVNAGSSSLKFRLFEMPSGGVLASGIVEKIGSEDTISTTKASGEKIRKVLSIPDRTKMVSILLEALVKYKIINSPDEIIGAGYRAIHGGEIFKESAPVTRDAIEKFVSLNDLAPLHNPASLAGYNASGNNLPNYKYIFMFDTAFHFIVLKESYIYALPTKYYGEYKIRRYGFHGTSHKCMSLYYVGLTSKKVEDTGIITCRLRNGASIIVVNGGKSINTSMGFTPLAGIMMGTRCGDIDPAVVTYIMKRIGATPGEVDDIMNMQSGMLGVSGISSDTRGIEDSCEKGNPAALLTAEMHVSYVINVVGGYCAQLGGADAIAFIGGTSENDTNIRKIVCDHLSVAFGIRLDEELNGKTRDKEVLLPTVESKIAVWLIPTNEELVIARDIYCLIV